MKKKSINSKKNKQENNSNKFRLVKGTAKNDLLINNILTEQQNLIYAGFLKTLTLNEDLNFISDNVKSFKKELNNLSEMGEMESLRLQMAMDRMSKMMSTLSNLLKKINKTGSEIISNLK